MELAQSGSKEDIQLLLELLFKNTLFSGFTLSHNFQDMIFTENLIYQVHFLAASCLSSKIDRFEVLTFIEAEITDVQHDFSPILFLTVFFLLAPYSG